ncbi:MAG: mycothiol acetyltransferase [Actinomycetota bacterium]
MASAQRDGFTIERLPHLSPADIESVTALVDLATRTDGVNPLSEHVWLHLKHGGDHDDEHLLVRDKDGLAVAYAHFDATDAVSGASTELVVHPHFRRQGIGATLVQELLTASPDGRLRLWAHGESESSAALAASLGFRRQRILWQMRRSLRAELPDPIFPESVTVSSFTRGRDEDEFLRVNAESFRGLHDQAAWDRHDLEKRLSEDWFDPEGIIMAWADNSLAGFHWTKIHGGENSHDPIGEVYVLAVNPAWQGRGLGRALTLAGLHHLRAQGLSQVMLYVDSSNEAGITLYSRLGFARWDTDVLYSLSQGEPHQ